MTGKQLKNSILQWAIQGKLVPQDPNDEPASVLLERIREEKARLVKEKKIKKPKNESIIYRGDDNSHYEKFADGTVRCIDDEIPFEIPDSWCWCKLSNIIELLSGQDFIPEKYNSSNLGIPYITGASNIVSGNLVINRWTETPTIIGKLGDLLIVCKGSGVGKMCICNVDKIHIVRQIQILRNFSDAISLSYIKSVIEANLQTIISNAQGVIPGISREHILNLLIPLPPTNEQYKIDNKIREILPVINQYTKCHETLTKLNVDLLESLKKSILQEAIQGKLVPQCPEEESASALLECIKAEKDRLIKEKKIKRDKQESVIFRGDDNCYYEQIGNEVRCIQDEIPFDIPSSWHWVTLAQIASLYTGNSISSIEKDKKYTNVIGTDYIGTKDVGFDNRIEYSNGVAIPNEYIDSFKQARTNDVLICIEGGSAGRKIGILNKDVCFGNKLCCVSSFGVNQKYLFYYLQSPSFFDSFTNLMSGIISGVSVNAIKTIRIALPPLEEQHRIVDKIEQLFKMLK